MFELGVGIECSSFEICPVEPDTPLDQFWLTFSSIQEVKRIGPVTFYRLRGNVIRYEIIGMKPNTRN